MKKTLLCIAALVAVLALAAAACDGDDDPPREDVGAATAVETEEEVEVEAADDLCSGLSELDSSLERLAHTLRDPDIAVDNIRGAVTDVVSAIEEAREVVAEPEQARLDELGQAVSALESRVSQFSDRDNGPDAAASLLNEIVAVTATGAEILSDANCPERDAGLVDPDAEV